jgi:hypothetical protein
MLRPSPGGLISRLRVPQDPGLAHSLASTHQPISTESKHEKASNEAHILGSFVRFARDDHREW